MYKLLNNKQDIPSFVLSTKSEVWITIPFTAANTDYQTFKADIAAGAELQDASGNVMSADDAQAFVATLP